MLKVRKLSYSYIPGKKVIDSVSFDLQQGKMLALIGESGSGKSTVLKLIYGFLELNDGDVFYNERRLEGFKGNLVPGEPDFKYLEQDFGLMPYSTVGENVGKFLSNIDMEEKRERVSFLLNLVEMVEYVDTRANDLSGGQKQRTALAKALAQTPSILLLDEPFSQVDTFKKNILKRAVFEFAKENNITIILATHDIEDALAYADEMIVIKDGAIVQKGDPSNIYKNPENEYVANLFGETNVFVPEKFPELFTNINEHKIFVYPHQLIISESGLKVKILKSYFAGSYYLVETISKLQRIWFKSTKNIPAGAECYLQVKEYQKGKD